MTLPRHPAKPRRPAARWPQGLVRCDLAEDLRSWSICNTMSSIVNTVLSAALAWSSASRPW